MERGPTSPTTELLPSLRPSTDEVLGKNVDFPRVISGGCDGVWSQNHCEAFAPDLEDFVVGGANQGKTDTRDRSH